MLCFICYVFSCPVDCAISVRELGILLLIVHRKLPIDGKEEGGTARERYVVKVA